MGKLIKTITSLVAVAFTAAFLAVPRPALAADAESIDRDARAALSDLYQKTPAARALGKKAKAILIFPSIVKAGLVVGAQHGKGALLVKDKTVGYYNISAASYGLQAGIQKFGYALFLMTDSARAYIDKSDGWELGVGPSIVIVDAGVARTLSTTTAKSDVYAFTFSQKGLMAGLGLQGTKITKVDR